MERAESSSPLSSLHNSLSLQTFSSSDVGMSTRLKSGAQKAYRAVSQTFSRTTSEAVRSYEVGSGADKSVSGIRVNRYSISPAHEKDYVLYSASGVFRSLFSVVKKEYAKIMSIKNDLEIAKKSDLEKSSVQESYVATDWEIVEGAEKVKGKFTAKAERAGGGDLDKAMVKQFGGVVRKRSYDEHGKLKIKLVEDPAVQPEAKKRAEFTQRQEFGAQYLQGMTNLHKAGWACGDPKPENALVYYDYDDTGKVVNQTVRISDFGKAERLHGKDGVEPPPKPYIGNPRFAPPEGVLTAKGDVYGAGIGLIRMWEEGVLAAEGGGKDKDETMMISTATMKETGSLGDSVPKSRRRGLERFLIRNKHSLAAEMEFGSYGSWIKCRKELNSRASQGKDRVITSQEMEQERQISTYVDALKERIEKSGTPVNKEELAKLCQLFRDMTSADPKSRPTMEEALQRYQALKVFPESTTSEEPAVTTIGLSATGPAKKAKPPPPKEPRRKPATATSASPPTAVKPPPLPEEGPVKTDTAATSSSSTTEATSRQPPPLPTSRPKFPPKSKRITP